MKPWLVLLTSFESGVTYIILVNAKTQQSARNKARRLYASGKDDMLSAFPILDMVKGLEDTPEGALEICTI